MCTFYTTQMALAFHPDSKVKTQEAYNCVDIFLNSLEEKGGEGENEKVNGDQLTLPIQGKEEEMEKEKEEKWEEDEVQDGKSEEDETTSSVKKNNSSFSKTTETQQYKILKKGSMAFLAIQILNKKITLHYTDIWSEIEKLGFLTRGVTPANSLGSELRRRDDIFKKFGKGIYGLHTYKTTKYEVLE